MAPASKRAPASQGSSSGSGSESDSDSEGENGRVSQRVQDFKDEDEVKEVKVDISKLNPLSPEVIEKQATINIGQSFLAQLVPLLFMRNADFH